MSLPKQALAKLHDFKTSIWLYPAMLLLLFAVFVSLGISGSSIEIYHSTFYGQAKDSQLIINHPRPIRSDEWLVNTQMTLAQYRDHFPAINHSIGKGEDMSIGSDVPYKDWSVFFKPQNLAFFVMPFDQAFAFRWWLWPVLLSISVYFFALKLLPKKRLFAALIATAFTCSPFIFWWFLSGTMSPLFYSITILLALMALLENRSAKQRVLISAALAYLLTCFALILYPPFQIPCVLAVVAFFAGYLLEKHRDMSWKEILMRLLWPVGATIVALVAIAVFVITRHDIIQTMTNTVYPGNRDIHSGGLPLLQLFSSQLSPIIQSNSRGANFFTNQSEASNFIFIAPFLIIPAIYLAFRRKSKHIDWPLLAVNALFIVLFARMFLAGGGIFYKALALNKVQHARLLIGLGLLQLFQIILIIRNQVNAKQKMPELLIWLFSLITLGAYLFSGFYVKSHYPIFIRPNEGYLVWGSALVMAGLIFSILKNWYKVFALLLLGFGLLSIFHIHPLIRGVKQDPDAKIVQAISTYPDGTWVVMNSVVFENLPLVAGKRSLTGVNLYPQLPLWRELDPGNQYSKIYNRYAHIYFTLNDGTMPTFKLQGTDNFSVAWDPCSQFSTTENIKYALSQDPLSNRCLVLDQKVDYPQVSFYIYKTVPATP